MIGRTLKRSCATLAVMAGLLALAGPASAARMAGADYCATGSPGYAAQLGPSIKDGTSNTLEIV